MMMTTMRTTMVSFDSILMFFFYWICAQVESSSNGLVLEIFQMTMMMKKRMTSK